MTSSEDRAQLPTAIARGGDESEIESEDKMNLGDFAVTKFLKKYLRQRFWEFI